MHGSNTEERAIQKAEEYMAWKTEHDRAPMFVCQGKKKLTATDDDRTEHRLAQWIHDMAKTKKGIKCTQRLYPGVEQFLIENLGADWWK